MSETRARRIEATGLVQGVGFRPFVYRLARELGLTGEVCNHSGGVSIVVEGDPLQLRHFEERLVAELPAPGRIERLAGEEVSPAGLEGFRIIASANRAGAVALVLPDLATCPECRRELLDPTDRRYGYPFLNCTRCGPRFSIVRDVPYDRPNTTMASFALCPACAGEYADPGDRRFHAQPTACAACGPRLRLLDPDGTERAADPLEAASTLLADGGIVAVKGIGGYHLACDARSEAAVARLRARKHREARPLAVMVAGLPEAEELGLVGPAERALLDSPAAPIVLLARRADCPLAEAVAPGVTRVGVMLAYAPLHILLLRSFGGPLVMTSGNVTDEPIAHRDDEALQRLAAIADALLVHDRPIERRCDDSVVAVWRGRSAPLRRSRGYAPEPVSLLGGHGCPEVVLAVGAHQKNTFCLVRGDEAFLSHHIGDLENEPALRAFETGVADFERLFDLTPSVLAHDLHPDYLATRYAVRRAEAEGLRTIEVQHHHAHIASCLADTGYDGPVIGVSFDGTGLGPDGTIWGGELLVADRSDYRRAGWLRPFRLAGGEAAVRQGWRVAVALAREAGAAMPTWPEVEPARAAFVASMLAKDVQCPVTTSAGRLFDGFAALLGLRADSRYEGEAAVRMEGACERAETEALPFDLGPEGDCWQLDWRAAVRAVIELRGRLSPEALAMRFHRGLAEATAEACRRLAEQAGLSRVALSGGCFQNLTLTTLLAERLEAAGLEVLVHRRVPANDGGLSLGQATVARARLREC